jgi:O-methyltransferase
VFEPKPPPMPTELLAAYPDLDPQFVAPYAAALPYTMTSAERMYALWQAVGHILAHRIPGALVECGVWRGGSSMLIAHTLLAAGRTDRQLWLYDTFEGMPEPSPSDVDLAGVPASEQLARAAGDRDDLVLAWASLAEVQANMTRVGYPADRITYVKGLVENTIPRQAPNQIALLRLDTDWEASTRHELEQLWPRLARGGVLIVDDYGHWTGARRAVDDYFAGRDDAPLLVRVDYTGRIAVRTTETAGA